MEKKWRQASICIIIITLRKWSHTRTIYQARWRPALRTKRSRGKNTTKNCCDGLPIFLICGNEISVPFPLWRLQRLRGRKPSDPCRGCSNFLCDMMAATCKEQLNAPQQRNAKDFTRRPKWFYIRFCCCLGFLVDDMLDGQTLPSPKISAKRMYRNLKWSLAIAPYSYRPNSYEFKKF